MRAENISDIVRSHNVHFPMAITQRKCGSESNLTLCLMYFMQKSFFLKLFLYFILMIWVDKVFTRKINYINHSFFIQDYFYRYYSFLASKKYYQSGKGSKGLNDQFIICCTQFFSRVVMPVILDSLCFCWIRKYILYSKIYSSWTGSKLQFIKRTTKWQ